MKSNAERIWISTTPSLHRLRTKPPIVDRVAWLEGRVASRSLIHLGDRMEDKTASGAWLHESNISTAQVGFSRPSSPWCVATVSLR